MGRPIAAIALLAGLLLVLSFLAVSRGPEVRPLVAALGPERTVDARETSALVVAAEEALYTRSPAENRTLAVRSEARAPAGEDGAFLLGTVFDSEGQPLSGASLRTVRLVRCSSDHPELDVIEQLDGLRMASVAGRTDEAGCFALAVPDQGPFVLEASRAGSGTEALMARPSTVVPWRLWLGPGHELKGRLADGAGKPAGGRAVFLLDSLPEASAGFRIETARTSRSGSFAFRNLAPRRYVLLIPLDEEGGVVATAHAPGEDLEVIDARGFRFRGVVRHAGSGAPIEGARVAVVGRRSFARGATLRDGGIQLSVADRVLQVSVRAPGLPVLHTQARVSEEGEVVVLRVGPEPGLWGRVVAPSGEGAAGVEVAAVGDEGPLAATITGADGGFILPPLPEGPVVLAARVPGCAPRLPPRARIRAEVDGVLSLEPTWRILGRIVGDTGPGVPGAEVDLLPTGDLAVSSALTWMRGRQHARTDHDGNFVLSDVVPRFRYLVAVDYPGFSLHEEDCAASPEGVLHILSLRRSCELAGRVLRPDGSPAALAAVFLEWPEGPLVERTRSERLPGKGLRTLTERDGGFFFERAPSGAATLRVQHPGCPEAVLPMNLLPGIRNGARIDLDAGVDVGVRILTGEGVPGRAAPLRLLGSTTSGLMVDRRATADFAGSHVFRQVPPGRYVVVSGTARSPIHVEARAEQRDLAVELRTGR